MPFRRIRAQLAFKAGESGFEAGEQDLVALVGRTSSRTGHRSGTRELPLTPLPYVVVYWQRIAKPPKSCTSITVRKIGVDGITCR